MTSLRALVLNCCCCKKKDLKDVPQPNFNLSRGLKVDTYITHAVFTCFL